MWNEPSKERLDRIPRLYETENVALPDKIVHLHCFFGGCDWWIFEWDRDDTFFGITLLNGDYQNMEAGYISYRELRDLNLDGLEINCVMEQFWEYPRTREIEKICRGMGWPMPGKEDKWRTHHNSTMNKAAL